jgi:hypothetical protein
MEHYDLAGLVAQSDAVVVATAEPAAHRYRVEQVLHGKSTVGSVLELDLDRLLYPLPPASPGDTWVVFLNGGHVVSSGLRLITGGQVFRFEQWDNPGGWRMVPQGPDPQDNWRGGVPQLDRPGFDRALVAAVRRVAALGAALAEPDGQKRRSALLAVLAVRAPGSARASGPGFYRDLVAERVEARLLQDGEVEAALLATMRDASHYIRVDVDPLRAVGIAQAVDKDPALRVAALEAVAESAAFFANQAVMTHVIALSADPAPAVRAAAVVTAARARQWGGGDRKDEAVIRKLVRQVNARLAALAIKETSPQVLYAIAEQEDHRVLGRRGGSAIVAQAHLSRGFVSVDVICLRRVRLGGGKVVATGPSGAESIDAIKINLRCGDTSSGLSGGVVKPLPAGRYALSVEVTVNRKPETAALGTLEVSADGEQRVAVP